MVTAGRSLRARLEQSTSPRRALFAGAMAFGVYFCMYAFRKPFSVGRWDGEFFFGSTVTLKTAFVLSQLFGYVVSKYVGVRVCPALTRASRLRMLVGLVGASGVGLAAFAMLPGEYGVLGLFASTLPLGMVWGTVLSYLEGRRESEAMMAGLSCSFIVAGGVVKDVGAVVLTWGVSENLMPLVTASLFALPFLVCAWGLDQVPEPSPSDIETRAPRAAMSGPEQAAFMKRYFPGLALMLVTYVGLTALRDYRDNYAIEILTELGEADAAGVFSRMELPAALFVMVMFGALSIVVSNRRAFSWMCGLITMGIVLIGVSTWLHQLGQLSAVTWLGTMGVGMYLAYVPFGSMLFERLIALTRSPGTAVLAAQLFDATGYTGSAAAALYKDLLATSSSRAQYFTSACLAFAILGPILMLTAWAYFVHPKRAVPAPTPLEP